MIALLLKNGKVSFRKLKSKKGTFFAAYLRYEKDEKTGYYNWKLEFINEVKSFSNNFATKAFYILSYILHEN